METTAAISKAQKEVWEWKEKPCEILSVCCIELPKYESATRNQVRGGAATFIVDAMKMEM